MLVICLLPNLSRLFTDLKKSSSFFITTQYITCVAGAGFVRVKRKISRQYSTLTTYPPPSREENRLEEGGGGGKVTQKQS